MQKIFTNSLLIMFNCVGLFVGMFLIEYEVSKRANPDVFFVATPSVFDWFVGTFLIILGLLNLAVAVFVIRRRLDQHRRWLWQSTFVGLAFMLLVALLLKQTLWLILWPW